MISLRYLVFKFRTTLEGTDSYIAVEIGGVTS